MNVAPLIAACVMALLHFFAGRLRFLAGLPRSRWLSIAGGISVAYVVVHLLPELAEYQEVIAERGARIVQATERHVYVVALVGLAAFYGVENASRAERGSAGEGDDLTGATVFSFATYTLYNATIGYLLVRREGQLLLFAIALGLHFLVTDYGLREQHGTTYHRYGRWVLSQAVVAGAALGYLAEVPEAFVGVLIAFIGGGTILNVLKEELPTERESRFGAFLAGLVGYTAVLLAA